jgi:hypothetical protein
MKNLICSIAVALSLIILGCDDDSIVNPIDSELQKNIVGTWKDNAGYIVTYFSNGTFTDSIFYFDQFTDTSIIIRKGNYNIANSVLIYSEFYFDTIITQSNLGFAAQEFSYEISISNSILKRIPFSVFRNIGQNRMDLWDKWETVSWFAQIDAVYSSETYHGSSIIQYNFIQDSSKCVKTTVFHNEINDSTFEFNSSQRITYNSPYLDINGYKNILVKFINKKMYWYYNYQPRDLFKVN